jgi:hypothetical protein
VWCRSRGGRCRRQRRSGPGPGGGSSSRESPSWAAPRRRAQTASGGSVERRAERAGPADGAGASTLPPRPARQRTRCLHPPPPPLPLLSVSVSVSVSVCVVWSIACAEVGHGGVIDSLTGHGARDRRVPLGRSSGGGGGGGPCWVGQALGRGRAGDSGAADSSPPTPTERRRFTARAVTSGWAPSQAPCVAAAAAGAAAAAAWERRALGLRGAALRTWDCGVTGASAQAQGRGDDGGGRTAVQQQQLLQLQRQMTMMPWGTASDPEVADAEHPGYRVLVASPGGGGGEHGGTDRAPGGAAGAAVWWRRRPGSARGYAGERGAPFHQVGGWCRDNGANARGGSAATSSSAGGAVGHAGGRRRWTEAPYVRERRLREPPLHESAAQQLLRIRRRGLDARAPQH